MRYFAHYIKTVTVYTHLTDYFNDYLKLKNKVKVSIFNLEVSIQIAHSIEDFLNILHSDY